LFVIARNEAISSSLFILGANPAIRCNLLCSQKKRTQKDFHCYLG
jgi:hypothetical protein